MVNSENDGVTQQTDHKTFIRVKNKQTGQTEDQIKEGYSFMDYSDEREKEGQNTNPDEANNMQNDDLAEEVNPEAWANARDEETDNSMGWWRYNMPSWLFGASEEEKDAFEKQTLIKYAAQMQPVRLSWWERNAPTWLGGATMEEVAVHNERIYLGTLPAEKPSFYERYMPTMLGGMSRQEIDAYDRAHPDQDKDKEKSFLSYLNPMNWFGSDDEEKAGVQEANPAYKEMSAFRYRMPSWLGGASDEEKQAYELKMAQTYTSQPMEKLSWLDRRPKILGGKGYLAAAIYRGREQLGHLPEEIPEGQTILNPLEEVIQGVTVQDMAEANFSAERIAQIQKNISKFTANVAQENGTTTQGLNSILAQNGQRLQITQEELGVSHEEMKRINQLHQNDR